ncbi:hypothetical protein LZ30DRAFT_708044 [Colletotrichum cereale]|nr:hypothetical protein LZ30DRAFT_708044 [Colletotrichum cereale]
MSMPPINHPLDFISRPSHSNPHTHRFPDSTRPPRGLFPFLINERDKVTTNHSSTSWLALSLFVLYRLRPGHGTAHARTRPSQALCIRTDPTCSLFRELRTGGRARVRVLARSPSIPFGRLRTQSLSRQTRSRLWVRLDAGREPYANFFHLFPPVAASQRRVASCR